jgi:CHASE3 domain sensor protein
MANAHTVAEPSPGRLAQWWLDRSVRAKGLVAMAIPLLALIGVSSAGTVLSHQERTQRQASLTANTLTVAARAVLVDAMDAETGVRGYVATGEPVFLTPYNAAVKRQAKDLPALQRAVTTPIEGARVDAIALSLNQEFAALEAMRQAVPVGSTGITGSVISAGLSYAKTVMDQLRQQIAQLLIDPMRLAAGNRIKISRLEAVIEAVQVAGLLLGVLAGLAAVALFTSGISARLRLAADNANRLGRIE